MLQRNKITSLGRSPRSTEILLTSLQYVFQIQKMMHYIYTRKQGLTSGGDIFKRGC